MSRHEPGEHQGTIIEMLKQNIKPKVIAYTLKVPYNTVVTLKHRYFDTINVMKEHIPDPDQGSFFDNYWRKDRL